MRILGVDPGSITTGFGVIDHVSGKIVLVEHGSIKTPRGEELSARLEIIHRTLSEIIGRTLPAEVAVETPFAGLNVKSLIQLSHARGVILLAARTAGLELFEYSPRSVKSAVVGYGAAEKEQVAKMVRLLIPSLGKSDVTPDAADALAIAICHAHSG
ncbi:MAG: crossover junction endodeoxyribonuclease RuvC [Nitrospiraceae bacterium]